MTNVNRRTILKAAGATAAVSGFGFPALVRAEGAALKIGQLGVMSGPEASWGLVNKFSALAVAELWNEKGGVEIDGTLRRVEIVSVDDRNDTKLSVLGAERLASEEGIRYIIGPNTDATALSVRPIAEKNGAMYFPYAFNPEVYRAPASNAVLGMITSYQIAPLMYKILKEQRGVGKAAFLARNDADGLARREEVAGVLGGLGVEVVAKDAYETSVTDFFPVVSNVVATKPDVIIMSSVASAHAPQIMRAAREMGYEGLFSCESGQDIKIINEVAGEYGNGLVSVGGASTPEIRSEYMEKFIEQYVKVAGEWNDEAGTKVYAPEIILATLQKAGAKAIDDIEAYKAVMPDFSVKNPFLKEESALTYVGMADFGQKRQIGVPMVITETKGGEFTTLAIGKVAS